MKEAVMTKQTLNLNMDTRELAHNSHSWNSVDNSIALTKKYAKNLMVNVIEFYKMHSAQCIKISDDKFRFERYAYSNS